MDILLGSKNEKVLRWEHDKLSTYNIGGELTKKQWMHLARQLVAMGYLKQDGEYHTLSLTAKALETLKKRQPIFGVVMEAERVKVKKEGKKKEELEYNSALFALLRQKRKVMADEVGVPPYVVFSDKTLVEMAAYYPQSAESLLNISGVGQMKLQQMAMRSWVLSSCITGSMGLLSDKKNQAAIKAIRIAVILLSAKHITRGKRLKV